MPTLPPPLRTRLRALLRRVLPASAPLLAVPVLAAPLLAVLTLAAAPAQAQGEYRIGRGDVLRIEVLEDDTLNRSVLVAPSGQVTVPLAGSVQAAGRTLSAVQGQVREMLAPNFSNAPTVFVSLEAVRPREPRVDRDPVTVDVFVLGEVGSPGRLQLEPGTTLLQALSLTGGFTDFAATKRMQLRRRDRATGVERIYPLNYDAILSGRSPNGTARMAEGDVIVVPTRRLFE